jgi:PhzF family phenazine biosynthesis protein
MSLHMPAPGAVLRYAAFAVNDGGGNPAGVVLDARGLDADAMLAIAAEVGYSETAFVVPGANGEADIRYFSPQAEVPFCGHATIATGVAWAERHGMGRLTLRTMSGPVELEMHTEEGRPVATLTSVPPHVHPADEADVVEALSALRWDRSELDPALPPRVAFAGAHHLILAAGSRERLGVLDYDFPRLRELMEARNWTTIQLVFRASVSLYHARDPFPPGGVVEDPATGAAAAALGAYLRELNLVHPPIRIAIQQGSDMGRPSVLHVEIPEGEGTGIRVIGTAVPIDHVADAASMCVMSDGTSHEDHHRGVVPRSAI